MPEVFLQKNQLMQTEHRIQLIHPLTLVDKFYHLLGLETIAIIQYVDRGPSKVSVQSSLSRIEQLPPPLLDTRRKLFSRLNNTETSRITSHVELKVLAGAQTDAVELAAGTGVAAATTANSWR